MKYKSNYPVVERALDAIFPYPLNVKIHEPKQIDKIVKSIQEFGWTQPIIVDKHGVIIAGHGRRLAAIKLNRTTVPVIVRDDLTDDQVRALRLADNRVALGGFDGEMLQNELSSLDFDMEGIFDSKELDFMKSDLSVVDDTKFMTDIDVAVREQTTETNAKVAAADEKEVPIAKAVGFKTILTKEEKHVAAFMAFIEELTGKQGAAAFIEHAKSVVAQAA